MANEGVIKVQYALTGEADITAAIYDSTDTIRDAQSAVALTDAAGRLGLYTNAGAITIEPGDSVIVSDGGVIIGGNTYQGDADVIDQILNLCEADIQIVQDAVNGWHVKQLKKGTATELTDKRMKDIDGNIITAENVTVGQHVEI